MELRIWLARHGRHCCLVNSQGGYSFGLFNYDSFRVVSDYRPSMGYLRLAAGLIFCSYVSLSLFLVPYPVGDSSLSLPCGTLSSSTVGDRY